MTQSDRVLVTDVFTVPVPHEPADQVVSGEPHTGTLDFGNLGEVATGIWELTMGAVRDTEVDEIFIVLSGTGRVDFEDGGSLALSPGICVRLHAGERTTWTITETLRKVWIA